MLKLFDSLNIILLHRMALEIYGNVNLESSGTWKPLPYRLSVHF